MVMLPVLAHPHKLRRLYAPFLGLAEHCAEVIGTVVGSFTASGHRYTVPRFTFLGPRGAGEQQRIGLFALIHGDEPAAAEGLLALLQTLADEPSLATGYDLVCYPVCNPTGFEDGTRHNRAGLDLNREFWHTSAQPEVQILEAELSTQRFHGLIALHADDTSEGLYGYAHGRIFNENLLAPALRAAEEVIPCNQAMLIDGFPARGGLISQCFCGVLAAPPEQQPQPFDLIFETPALAPHHRQVEATRLALLAILGAHRGLLSYAADL